MSVVATILRELMALGVEGDALVSAVDRIAEAVENERARSVDEAVAKASAKADREFSEHKAKAVERTRKWREAQAANKAVISPNVTERHGDGGDASPPCERPQVVTPSLPSLRSEELKPPVKPSGLTAPKGQKSRGSKRVPDSWSPAETTLARLAAEGHTSGDLERALTRMRDHEYRTPHTDWDAAFRNWVRLDADRKPRHERPHHDAKFDARQANSARADAGAFAAARQRFQP